MERRALKQCISRITSARRWISAIVGLVLLLTPHYIVDADNTEDLLNVYGLTLGGPIKSEIERQMERLENDLLSMQTQSSMTEEYNAVLAEYISKREDFIDDVLNDISVYQASNDKIGSRIEDNLLDCDISELLKLDSQYKTNSKYVNDLLSTMNDYRIDYSYRNMSVNMSDVESQLSEARSLYIESIDTFDLGKVSDIDFVLDTERHINSQYGYRVDPINKGEVRFHSGTDYRAVEGSPIKALFNGTVISSGWSNSIGNFVTVQSGDNIKYLVCHCSKLNVVQGQYVSQGEVIAYVGGTGSRCTGPHLHMALYINGVSYDVDELFK